MPYLSLNPTTSKQLKMFEEITGERRAAAIATAATCFDAAWLTAYSEIEDGSFDG